MSRRSTLTSMRFLPETYRRTAVNGQFLVPAGGQQKSQPFTCSLLLFCRKLTSPRSGLFHPERLAAGDDNHAVVHESIEETDRGVVLWQEPSPLLEGPVRRDAESPVLVGGGDETKEQLGPGVVHRREADLINQD